MLASRTVLIDRIGKAKDVSPLLREGVRTPIAGLNDAFTFCNIIRVALELPPRGLSQVAVGREEIAPVPSL